VSAIAVYDDLPDRTWGVVELTKGKWAKVDRIDLPKVMFDCWYYHDQYAARQQEGRIVWMHRLILGLAADDPLESDHINHDKLDNRRENLRIASPSQNNVNRRKQAGTSSRFIGVQWHKQSKKWRAVMQVNGKRKHLGYFPIEDEIEAARAYNVAALETWGGFAYPNDV
jgi:hypothetical protein